MGYCRQRRAREDRAMAATKKHSRRKSGLNSGVVSLGRGSELVPIGLNQHAAQGVESQHRDG